jgi:hypothetical protein
VYRRGSAQGVPALAPLDPLMAVVAADRDVLLDRLDALRVDDRRRGLGIPARTHPFRPAKGGEDATPYAVETEAAEVIVDGLPGREISGHTAQGAPAPLAAGAEQVEDGIEDSAEGMATLAQGRGERQVAAQADSLCVGQVGRIVHIHAGKRSRRPVLSPL